MTYYKPRSDLETHSVVNQPPPLENVNLFACDRALMEAMARHGGAAHGERLSEFGAALGRAETIEWGRLANENPPKLKSFDRFGQRLDEAEFHPAYHDLMRLGLESGLSSIAWTAKTGGHVAHSAMLYLMSAVDGGVCCPMSMTYAVVPALAHAPGISTQWRPKLTAAKYDPRFIPATEKTGVTMGMAMTEKQGGSDVRANSTRAQALGGDAYELTGHKWFCSAPMSDAFLTLAQTEAGLTCFFVPRWTPEGARNAIHVMRLKDKLGDRSNASSEIEYHGAFARRVGEEGRGVATIIEMVHHTRLDCVVGSAGGMRAALTQAVWHCAHRTAFQKKLIDQPLMRAVLADLSIEAEAACALAFRLAGAFDRSPTDENEAIFARAAAPIAKYWICKRFPGVAAEAMECVGGAGYVEESPMPRLYRQAPLNAIWEGSGNIMALDLLRAMHKAPATIEILAAELREAAATDARLEQKLSPIIDLMNKPVAEAHARRLVERLALGLQAAALVKCAPNAIVDGFIALRLCDGAGDSYGAGPETTQIDAARILERAAPAL